MKTVYVSVGNSDDNLTQQEWAAFLVMVSYQIRRWGGRTHGVWYSEPVSQYQNACWCFEIINDWSEEELKKALKNLAREYRQDSIAWAEVAVTHFLEPTHEPE